MEVKPGYKQTGVGTIPEDWEVDSLKRFWSVIDCKHLTAEFVEDGIPLASIREVQSKYVDLEKAKKTTDWYYSQLIDGRRKPVPGDLIFSRNATVGEVALVAVWHPPFAMGQDVCLLRKKSAPYSSEFLQAVIRSPLVLNQLTNLMVGSTFKRVNVEQIRNLTVVMPQPKEQRAIAAALSDLDALLTKLDALIAKKRGIKQAAMQQLLSGARRLPGFSGEWEVKRLDDVARLNMGQSPDSKYYNRSGIGIPLVQGNADLENRKSIGRVWTTQITKVCDEGDLILTVRAPVGSMGIASEYLCLGRGVCSLKPIDVHPPFLFHTLVYAEDRWRVLEQGSTFTSANSAQIAAFPVMVAATLEEQRAIAEVLSDMDAEIAALEARREKTRALKQGMMQDLLTGRIRLLGSSRPEAVAAP